MKTNPQYTVPFKRELFQYQIWIFRDSVLLSQEYEARRRKTPSRTVERKEGGVRGLCKSRKVGGNVKFSSARFKSASK